VISTFNFVPNGIRGKDLEFALLYLTAPGQRRGRSVKRDKTKVESPMRRAIKKAVPQQAAPGAEKWDMVEV